MQHLNAPCASRPPPGLHLQSRLLAILDIPSGLRLVLLLYSHWAAVLAAKFLRGEFQRFSFLLTLNYSQRLNRFIVGQQLMFRRFFSADSNPVPNPGFHRCEHLRHCLPLDQTSLVCATHLAVLGSNYLGMINAASFLQKQLCPNIKQFPDTCWILLVYPKHLFAIPMLQLLQYQESMSCVLGKEDGQFATYKESRTTVGLLLCMALWTRLVIVRINPSDCEVGHQFSLIACSKYEHMVLQLVRGLYG